MNHVRAEEVAELSTLLGAEKKAERILSLFSAMAAIYGDAPAETFQAKDGLTDAQRHKRLSDALSHMDALTPLLDSHLAWVTACYMPNFSDGPEVAEENENRVAAVKASLLALHGDLQAALNRMPAVRRGRKLELSPRLMLLIRLVSELESFGLKFSAGESSKMVKAVRICWEHVGFDGDPRDLLRTLADRRNPGA